MVVDPDLSGYTKGNGSHSIEERGAVFSKKNQFLVE